MQPSSPTPPTVTLPTIPATYAAPTTPLASAAGAPPTQLLAPAAKRIRTWPAALALLFVSPGIAELLSGSTPPLLFVQPFALIFLPTLYGISALLIREIMVRRGLGWGNALLMGAAFGIFQEALVVQTWFNFVSPRSPAYSYGTYGAVWGTSWNWALNLTIYHAFISITAPLILIGLLFPRQAALPWLGRKRIVALTLWLLASCGLLAYAVAFTQLAADGYSGPPLVPYLVAAGLTILAMLLGAFVRFPVPQPARSPRRAPRPWVVRLAIFGLIVLFFVVTFILPATHLPAMVDAAVGAALFALAVWRVRAWSARPGWGDRHWLALPTGIVLYFALLWGPLVEFAAHQPQGQGLVLTDLLALVLLLLFDWRLKRRAATMIREQQ
ncbi:MAG TPA: hypothetical protein VFU88_20480 [Ktedonobacterales bacterium]|nr:hypothetical protein [Ktedonobacterales bacterium]